MIQSVEKLPDVHFQNPAAVAVHRLFPQRLQRLVRRPSGPEAVRTGVEVLLVNGLQQHDDRPLQDLVLQSRDTDRSGLGSRAAFRNQRPGKKLRSGQVTALQLSEEDGALLRG